MNTLTPPPVEPTPAPESRAAAMPARHRTRDKGKSRRSRRWLSVAAIAVVLAAAASGYGRWREARAAPDKYLTATVTRGSIEDATTALGTLQPRDYVDVGAQVSGQLRKIFVQIGDKVKQGDFLAEIDPTVLLAKVEADKAQLMNLRAVLADKEAQLVLARQQFQRQSNLLKANATSQDAFQSAEATQRSAVAQVDSVKAQIRQTESSLKANEANLGYTKIVAPMDGVVVTQIAKQGQTLNANQTAPIILRIADLSTMTVWTQVSEADVVKLKVGMDAYFTTLGRPDKRWYGKLRQVLPSPEIINNVVLYNALFDVPNPTGELMTQMSTQVFFVSAAAADALLVPMAALRPAGGGKQAKAGSEAPATGGGAAAAEPPAPAADAPARARYAVQVMIEDGAIETRRITTGVANRVAAQVLSGLKESERVVVGLRQPDQKRGAQTAARTPRLK